MPDLTEGEKQRREINTYNLFYSSVTDRASPPLSEHGVRIPMLFPTLGENAEPDFVLYDGQTCCLAEIKSGNNINEEDIKQMRRNSSLEIETLEEELGDANVREKTPYDGSVSSKESIIVYQDLDEEYIEENEGSDSFTDALQDITDHAVVMTQDYGGRLRVLEGEFNDDNSFQRHLRNGINLPENPPDEIMLTENCELESIAMAICDIWGDRAVDHEDGVTVSREEVRNFFAPQHNIGIGQLDLVFEFLTEFGACEKVEEGSEEHQFKFTMDHISSILSVEGQVMEETVMEYLTDEDQATFDDDEIT